METMKILLVVGAVYLVMSVVTFVAYWKDKVAATKGAWRTPEKTLHKLELMGGWPGALVAQKVLRHKTRDIGYRRVFWAIVGAHVAGLAAIISGVGR